MKGRVLVFERIKLKVSVEAFQYHVPDELEGVNGFNDSVDAKKPPKETTSGFSRRTVCIIRYWPGLKFQKAPTKDTLVGMSAMLNAIVSVLFASKANMKPGLYVRRFPYLGDVTISRLVLVIFAIKTKSGWTG